jgi:hypothetical protein
MNGHTHKDSYLSARSLRKILARFGRTRVVLPSTTRSLVALKSPQVYERAVYPISLAESSGTCSSVALSGLELPLACSILSSRTSVSISSLY